MRMSVYLLIGLVTALSTGTASAEIYHAAQCTASGSDATVFGRNRSGTFNSSTTATKRLHCGAATEGAILSASATVYDRSVTDDVDCTFYITNPSGTALFTANRQTTGFAQASMTLNFGTVPSVSGAVVMHCLLPADNEQNGPSYLSTYTINDSE